MLSNLIENDTYRVGALYNLGLVNHKLGKYAESIHYLSQAVEQDPGNVTYRYAYGLALTDYGDLGKAGEQMREVLLIDPENIEVHEWIIHHKPPE